MPSIRIRDYEADEHLLPEVCMCCGEPATVHKNKQFSWYPSWVIIIMVLALLPGLIVALVLTKRMRVSVPLCDRHRYHWLVRTLTILLGFVGCIVWTIAAVVFASDPGMRDMETLILLSIPVAFLAWLITTALMMSTSIRPTEITERGITLTGVSVRFIDALDDLRQEERDRRLRFREKDREMDLRQPREQLNPDDERIRRPGDEDEDRYRD